MNLADALLAIQKAHQKTKKPIAVVLAGHNGSGKSTLWREHFADQLRLPLLNADRLMLAVLPELDAKQRLRPWAQTLRDTDERWMLVARDSVKAFQAQAMAKQAPFAVETVFSYQKKLGNGRVASKVDDIEELKAAGYFVLLVFVGLPDVELSIARVSTREAQGGHSVPLDKLQDRFPRTQQEIKRALAIVDASILVDNGGEEFLACVVRLGTKRLFDVRKGGAPAAAYPWLGVVDP